MSAILFYEIKKYNPYHGADGKFTSGGGSVTTVPGKAKVTATARIKESKTDSQPKPVITSKTTASDIQRYDPEKYTFIRKDPPPKKTVKAYKVFVVKDGKLYPPMVANPGRVDTPVGVWVDAAEGERAPDSKTGRKQVKAGGKGTQGGSGSLAYRPGWHLGEVPDAKQFARKDEQTGKKELFPKDFVWAECDVAADIDYQKKAMSYGYTKSGKFQHSLAGLPELPKDGCYRYRTNPNPETNDWLITGSMKVNRVLSDKETDAILRANGITPMRRQGGRVDDLTQLGLNADGSIAKSANRRSYLFNDIRMLGKAG